MVNKVNQTKYLSALGARIFSEANDLKRTPETLAAEVGMDFDTVQAVIEGRAGPDAADVLIRAMATVYPVSLADLWVDPDDTDRGVKIMRAEDSLSTARIFDRNDSNGRPAPYYEYRDTAMSRIAPFKPEWIQPIRIVGDNNPDNPDVAYNNGHLMHQCTFFIGEVNFYWRTAGRNYCAEMNTGDSNYITPFVPHSFTSRNPDRPGLIVAVTYADHVRRAINEFRFIGADAAVELAGDSMNCTGAFLARLDRHLGAESLSRKELAERLETAGMAPSHAGALTDGRAVPSHEELVLLAEALHLRVQDLIVSPMKDEEAVSVHFTKNSLSRPYPKGNKPRYRISELVRNRRQPGLRGFEMTVLDDGERTDGAFRHRLHQYVYNYGDVAVSIEWNDGDENMSQTLEPNDSAYFRPMVAHSFAVSSGAGEGHLAVVRIPGALNDTVVEEFATFAPEGRGRTAGETKQWF